MIFTWIGTNLDYDYSRVQAILDKQESDKPNPALMTLGTGRGICTDLAALYEEMCEAVKVPCKTMSGLTKDFDFSPLPKTFQFGDLSFADVLTAIKRRNNSKLDNRFLGHVWNVVWIDEDEPKVVDITMAMGASNNATTKKNNTSTMVEGFNPYYFNLPNSELALSHLPYWGEKSADDFARDFYFTALPTATKLQRFFRDWVTDFSPPAVSFMPPLEVTLSLAHSCIGLNSSKGMFYYTDIVGNANNPSGDGNAKVYICIGCRHAQALQGVIWVIVVPDKSPKNQKVVRLDQVPVPSTGPTDNLTRNTLQVNNNIKLDDLLPNPTADKQSQDIYVCASATSDPEGSAFPLARFDVLWPKKDAVQESKGK